MEGFFTLIEANRLESEKKSLVPIFHSGFYFSPNVWKAILTFCGTRGHLQNRFQGSAAPIPILFFKMMFFEGPLLKQQNVLVEKAQISNISASQGLPQNCLCVKGLEKIPQQLHPCETIYPIQNENGCETNNLQNNRTLVAWWIYIGKLHFAFLLSILILPVPFVLPLSCKNAEKKCNLFEFCFCEITHLLQKLCHWLAV